MSLNSFPYSPTSQNYSNPSKSNRLYHQLLQNNYLNDHIYHPSSNATAPATIKFGSVHPPNNPAPATEYPLRYDSPTKTLKYSNPFKTFQGSKNNHQITQSFPSNYSIQEMQNESYSTINLYNLSRNNIEPDLSLSSNNITAKLNHDLSAVHQQHESGQLGMILQGSEERQEATLHDISVLQLEEKMKKYHSQEYSGQSSNNHPNIEEEIQSPLPRMLANKYIRDDFSRKFSGDHPSEENSNFRPVLNEIHIVPYKINETVQPYAFSLPVEGQRDGSLIDKKGKTASLNLHKSNHTQPNEEMPSNNLSFSNVHIVNQQQTSLQQVPYSPSQHILYPSNQPNPYLSNQQITYSSNQYFPYPFTQQISYPPTQHIPLHYETHETNKIIRQSPKSEPKPHHVSNQKTTRSNSIGCKNKPMQLMKSQFYGQMGQERPDEPFVSRMFKQDSEIKMQEGEMIPQECSIIMEDAEVNVCCGLVRDEGKPTMNRINFKGQDEKGTSFCDSPQIYKYSLGSSKQTERCKINPMRMIKHFHDGREGENQKKGIRLVGFNPSFPKQTEG